MQRTRAPLASLEALLLAIAGCNGGGGGEGSFGLAGRTDASGLTFPTGLPPQTPLKPRVAFPHLAFAFPIFLTAPPDGTDRVSVVEKSGIIHVFPNDPAATTTKVFLDISSQVINDGELGCLGFAFHPDYAVTGLCYVYYSVNPDMLSRVSRFQVTADPDRADPASETVLLELDEQPFPNHKAGMLAFGPDRMLYISVGDGGGAGDPRNNAQSLTSPLGKILRLDPSGSIPPDNPFVGMGGGVREEIWAYGLRNPWRFSFDRATGKVWAGDVGQDAVEEVDILVRGGNYGWRVYEGDRSYDNPSLLPPGDFEQPVISYEHSLGMGGCVIGGYAYRGPSLPAYQGAYFYSDFLTGHIWALVHDGSRVVFNREVAHADNPLSFGEDQQGELYLCTLSGFIYRFDDPQGPPPPFPATLSATGLFASTPALVAAPGVIEYDVSSPLWSDGARKRRWLALPAGETIGFSPTGAWTFPVGTALVKHFEMETAPGQIVRLETRVLLRHTTGWQGYTYRWNEAQDDADLLEDSQTAAYGESTWYFPRRADCLACHTEQAGRVLGVRTQQLNRDFAYPVRSDNQLRAWNHIGLFDRDIGNVAAYGALSDPRDASRP